MKLSVDQKIVCEIDSKLIDNIFNNIIENDWNIDDYRNKAENMLDVNSIPIFHSKLCGISQNALLTVEKKPLFDKYYPLIKPILDILKKYYNFNYHTSFLAKLKSNGKIGIHSDSGKFLIDCHRIHVPIKTNEKVVYWINNKEYYWEKGFIYEFDNTLPHGVFNNSDEERIHLIINLYNLNSKDLEKTNKI